MRPFLVSVATFRFQVFDERFEKSFELILAQLVFLYRAAESMCGAVRDDATVDENVRGLKHF